MTGCSKTISSTSTPSKLPLRPRNVFDPVVVLVAGSTLNVKVVEIPTGERARAFAHVLLGVVADAHREQLHDLAREVLVRRALHVVLRVEEVQHRRSSGRPAIVSSRRLPVALPLEQIDLLQHLAVVAHLVLVRREVAVPEQRHLLFHRVRRLQHPVRPPVTEPPRLEHRGAQPVEEAVRHRLHGPVAGRLARRRPSTRRARSARSVASGRLSGKRSATDPRDRTRRTAASLDSGCARSARATATARFEPEVGELLDLLRRAAEARMRKQMRGAIVAPFGCAAAATGRPASSRVRETSCTCVHRRPSTKPAPLRWLAIEAERRRTR